MSIVETVALVFGISWAIGALSGCIAYFGTDSEDPADYARAIFWPIVLFVFVCKGIVKLIKEA